MTTKKVLAVVVDHLNNAPRPDAMDLWRVLTALRGPDWEEEDLKRGTTAVVRGAIGMNVIAPANSVHPNTGCLVSPGWQDLHLLIREWRDLLEKAKEEGEPHFLFHIQAAGGALQRIYGPKGRV